MTKQSLTEQRKQKRDHSERILPATQSKHKIIHILEEEIEAKVIYFFCSCAGKA